jgi:uncharacterized membrane protein
MVGQVTYSRFFQFAEPHIEGISFQITDGSGLLKTPVLFSMLLALLPVLTVFLWKYSPIYSTAYRFLSAITMLVLIGTGIWTRHAALTSYFNVKKDLIISESHSPVSYPVNPVMFICYMFIGLLVGCLISHYLFRQRKNSNAQLQ